MARGLGRPTKCSIGRPRPCPAHQKLFWWVASRPSPSNFHLMGRGPARPVIFHEVGPRPGPPHPFFYVSPSGPAWPIRVFKLVAPRRLMRCSIVSARSSPAHDIGDEAHETRARNGTARHLCRPVRGFEGQTHGPARVLPRTKRCTLVVKKHQYIYITSM